MRKYVWNWHAKANTVLFWSALWFPWTLWSPWLKSRAQQGNLEISLNENLQVFIELRLNIVQRGTSTHRGLGMHICVIESDHYWFRQCQVTFELYSHSDVYRSFIWNNTTFTKYCLTQWISKLPCCPVRQYLVKVWRHSTATVCKTEPIVAQVSGMANCPNF